MGHPACTLRALETARTGLWVVSVPTKMAWLLQPLETDAFSRWKCSVMRTTGCVAATIISITMNGAGRKVFQAHDWAAAFLRHGFGAVQSCVERSMGEGLGLDQVQSAGSALPTLMQPSAIFPSRLEALIN